MIYVDINCLEGFWNHTLFLTIMRTKTDQNMMQIWKLRDMLTFKLCYINVIHFIVKNRKYEAKNQWGLYFILCCIRILVQLLFSFFATKYEVWPNAWYLLFKVWAAILLSSTFVSLSCYNRPYHTQFLHHKIFLHL